jgi:hypothetical protein
MVDSFYWFTQYTTNCLTKRSRRKSFARLQCHRLVLQRTIEAERDLAVQVTSAPDNEKVLAWWRNRIIAIGHR